MHIFDGERQGEKGKFGKMEETESIIKEVKCIKGTARNSITKNTELRRNTGGMKSACHTKRK